MSSIRIRAAVPADAGAIARVNVDTWRTAYSGIVPADFLAGLSCRDSQLRWEESLSAELPGTGTVVAVTGGGKIVGFTSGGPERLGDPAYLGEIYAVYVLQDQQRRGVGKRLFAAMVQQLLRDGFASMMLWVLEDNVPARRFYESAGGELVGRRTTPIGGADLTEVSYGWKDIALIA